MTKIEQNALRIAELMWWEYNPVFNSHTKNCVGFLDAVQIKDNNELIDKFSSYNGLMPIVESEISEYELKSVHFEVENIGLLESVQNYVIKYLELKNNAGKAN